MMTEPSAAAMRAAEKIASVVWPKLVRETEQAEQSLAILARLIDAEFRPLVEALEFYAEVVAGCWMEKNLRRCQQVVTNWCAENDPNFTPCTEVERAECTHEGPPETCRSWWPCEPPEWGTKCLFSEPEWDGRQGMYYLWCNLLQREPECAGKWDSECECPDLFRKAWIGRAATLAGDGPRDQEPQRSPSLAHGQKESKR